MTDILRLRVGETVEVRSESEIAATLDENGKYDGVSFMPEMRKFCGLRFRVFKRAHKVCVEGYGVRRLTNSVLLEDVRCDGTAHAGCQRACLIFWKKAWLKETNDAAIVRSDNVGASANVIPQVGDTKSQVFSCQSTELSTATASLPWWDVGQYASDILSGNLTFLQVIRTLWNVLGGKIPHLPGSQTCWMTYGSERKRR